MTDHRRVIANTRARIGAVLGLRTAVTVLSAWLLAWGTIVFVLRGALLVSREPLLWGLLGVVAAAIVGTVVAVRRRPSAETVRALLDSHWRCGGLLMAAGDVDTGAWPIDLPASAYPRVHWQGRRQCGILLGCTAFLLAGFLMPASFFGEMGPRRLLIGAEVDKLADKVELLKDEKFLPPERAKSLELAIEQLRNDASGNDPAKTWEAMDHLEQSVAKASAEAAENAARDAEKAAKAEELAAALDKARDQMAGQDLTEAMSLFAHDMQQALEDNELLADDLSEALKEQCEKGELDPQQLAELAKALGKCKSCDLAKLRKLVNARMIDASLLERCQGQCEIDPEALAELLVKCQGSAALGQCIGQCNKPGRGSVTRGRGDAAMTWTDGANRDDMAFKEKVLPPGAVASLKDSRLQGISVGDPTAAQPGEVSAGGSLDASTAGRGSARTQVILPEHKKVVQRYFSREPAGKSSTPANP